MPKATALSVVREDILTLSIFGGIASIGFHHVSVVYGSHVAKFLGVGFNLFNDIICSSVTINRSDACSSFALANWRNDSTLGSISAHHNPQAAELREQLIGHVAADFAEGRKPFSHHDLPIGTE